jgi:hypothetical protein
MMNEPPPWDSEMSRFGGSEDSTWNEKLREVAKEMGLVSSSVPPPWDDELSRLGELEDEEGYEFVPQENYQVLYDETLDVYAKYYLDWDYLISTPRNNPIEIEDINDEWKLVTQMNAKNVVNQRFITNIGLEENRISNYEPIYFESLKIQYAREYEIAKEWFKKQWTDKENNGFMEEVFELDQKGQFEEFIESIANGYSFMDEIP